MIVLLSPRAREDLRSIERWTQEHFGETQAASYIFLIIDELEALQRGHRAGRPISTFPRYLALLIQEKPKRHGHWAIYEVQEDTIWVHAFFHTAQDWQSKLAGL